MMRRKNAYSFLMIGLVIALLTSVCSSGYVTPASLTATAGVNLTPNTPLPTAFFSEPTLAPTDPPPTEAPDVDAETNISFSPTPTFPQPTVTPTATAEIFSPEQPPLLYYTQAGDTLQNLTMRFGVAEQEIVSDYAVPEEGFLNPDQMLMIPLRLVNTTPSEKIIPDSELVDSPSTINYDPITYINTIGGYLSTYKEYLGSSGWNTGAEMVERVALENSINPRLLLSLLEYQSGWVLGQPHSFSSTDYPLGKIDFDRQGLHSQLVWAVNQLSIGYYGWRDGSLTDLTFPDGTRLRLAPELNAGTVAVMYFFSQVYDLEQWFQAIDPATGLLALHTTMFSDPWGRAQTVEPLFPPDLEQPPLILPFLIGQRWSYTGGPHGAWEHDGAQAALDFAPGSIESGCVPSDLWVTAVAPGVVVRKDKGVVVLDLDGDGYEQTGWVILYLHVTDTERVEVGSWLDKSDYIGHPSCEGGISTGTHVHIARKYNGEWMAADGPIPFVLSGWEAHASGEPYEGTLTRGEETIPASIYGTAETKVLRSEDDP